MSNLPNLRTLYILELDSICGRVFDNFTTLEKLIWSVNPDVIVSNLKEGLFNAIVLNKNLKEIHFTDCSTYQILDTVKSMSEPFKVRNSNTPMLLRLDSFSINIIPVKCEKDSSSIKLLFEIYEISNDDDIEKCLPNLRTYDEEYFIKQVESYAEKHKMTD